MPLIRTVLAALLLLAAPALAAESAEFQLKDGARNVGILIYDDVYNTEFIAPLDVFQHTGERMNVFTVAPTPEPIRTYEGLVVVPHFSFESAPRIDVLVVPSGDRYKEDLLDEPFIAWIRKTAASAETVTSHCWGAFLLAQAGVLDGKRATTFPSSNAELAQIFPKIRVVSGQRFVEDGKVITSAGGLASFEAALYLVEKLYGAELADRIAGGLVYAPENRSTARSPLAKD